MDLNYVFVADHMFCCIDLWVDDDEREIGPCCYNIGLLALFGAV